MCRPKDHANFFATTKFFSCLDLAESQELLESSQMVCLRFSAPFSSAVLEMQQDLYTY